MKPEEKKKTEAEENQLLSDARAVMATAEGRRLALWFFDMFPVDREAYTGNANTYYVLGQLSVSRTVKNLLADAEPNLFVPLIFRKDFDCAKHY